MWFSPDSQDSRQIGSVALVVTIRTIVEREVLLYSAN
jgi:hypothetical protein